MKKKPPSVHTIGYEQSGLGQFIERLTTARIDLVVDVRAIPLSRKPGFSKKQLAVSLEAVDVEYLHIARLGAPREIRDALRAGGDWADYERGYKSHLKNCTADLSTLHDLAIERMICLLCFERDPAVCHRSLIADRMLGEQPELVIQHIRY